ncbi:DUF397 domain-containing protein [Sphaerisporangium sp. NPDC049002]|uniref:DUF397 domain-containing protein n=1 Tax=Sphaerisporangium sp. NPDC049002 TaxID=3155392 RepID=UPI0033F57A2D
MAIPEEISGAAWRISTWSANGGGECVEAGPLADGTGRVAVRHSRRPDREVILYTRGEWEAFVAGVKAGEFDFFTG